MALDFSVLTQVPTFAERFMTGRQAAQEEAQRNMLLQQRQMEFQQSQEDRRLAAEERRLRAQRQAEEDEWLGKMASLFEQNNEPFTLENAQKGLSFAVRSRNAPAIQMMQKTVEALRGRAVREELLGGMVAPAGAPAPMPAPVAAPQELSALAVEQAAQPRPDFYGQGTFAGTAPTAVTSPVGEFPAEPAPAPINQLALRPAPVANAMAAAPAVQVTGPAAMPTAAAPSAAVQEQIASLRAQQRRALAAGEKDIAAYFGSQIATLEAQIDPRKGILNTPYGPLDVVTRQYIMPESLPGRARTAAPEARVKPVAPIRVRPGEVVISPETGQPIFTAPPAPARAPAGRAAAAPGAPAAGTPAQQAKAEAQQAAQTKLSQDLQTQLGYYEELAQMGAMSSPGRPVLENVIAYARSSGLGQEAERAAGTKAQTLRDNIANARQRILMHVKNATSATAGQMNSNMELQTWLRSLTDPQQSIETVRETLKQMDFVIAGVREQVAREAAAKGGAGAAPAAGGSGGWSVVR